MDGAIKAQPRRLVLASTSKYRKALLERLGLAFETATPRVDERALHGESAADTALRLSALKAQAVDRMFPDALIIGSDQVAAMGRERFGKPGDHASAVRIRLVPFEGGGARRDRGYFWIHVGRDLDGLFAKYRAAGVEIVAPPTVQPWGLRDFRVRDADGHLYCFAAEA